MAGYYLQLLVKMYVPLALHSNPSLLEFFSSALKAPQMGLKRHNSVSISLWKMGSFRSGDSLDSFLQNALRINVFDVSSRPCFEETHLEWKALLEQKRNESTVLTRISTAPQIYFLTPQMWCLFEYEAHLTVAFIWKLARPRIVSFK